MLFANVHKHCYLNIVKSIFKTLNECWKIVYCQLFICNISNPVAATAAVGSGPKQIIEVILGHNGYYPEAAEQGGHRGTVPPLPLQISCMTPKSAPKVPLNSPRIWKFWLPTVDFNILLQLHIEQICPYLC